MKISLALFVLTASLVSSSAFSVVPRALFSSSSATARARRPAWRAPLAAAAETDKAAADDDSEVSFEEEVERMVEEEKAKTLRMSKMSNERGMEYAPWMNITPDDLARIRSTARDKAEARRRRQTEQQNVRGSLLQDSTNQELSGTGLRGTVVDGDTVELEWATGSESGTTLGFLVKRRAAKTPDFVTLASYETSGPLASKGADGGVYRYTDANVGLGTSHVYRITEMESNGQENDLSQCLVEIPSEADARNQALALAGFAVAAVAVLAAGLFLDPVQ